MECRDERDNSIWKAHVSRDHMIVQLLQESMRDQPYLWKVIHAIELSKKIRTGRESHGTYTLLISLGKFFNLHA